MKKNHEHIRHILIEQRTKAKLSLRTVSDFAGIEFSRMARLESGKYDIYFHEIQKLSVAYDCDLYAELCTKYYEEIIAPLVKKKADIIQKNTAWLNQKVFMSQEHKDAWEAQEAKKRAGAEFYERIMFPEKDQTINDAQIDDINDII